MKEKNSAILRNTLYLYIRMAAMTAVGLFTARIIYRTLGVEDYGTYNAAAGIVALFTFVNSTLAMVSRRYLASCLVTGDAERQRLVFNVCLQTNLLLCTAVLLLSETIGLGIVTHVLNIPEGSRYQAVLVFHFSVLAAVLGILRSLMDGVVVAHERMSIFAWMTFWDVAGKILVVAGLLYAPPPFRLSVYGGLLFAVSLLDLVIWWIYCRSHFIEVRFTLRSDRALLVQMLRFFGWSLLGRGTQVASEQGVSVLINRAFGVTVNAAVGVGATLQGVVSKLVNNYQTAFHPAVIKAYNSQDWTFLNDIIIRSGKMSGILYLFFFVPLVFVASDVLTVWLGEYPAYAVEFCLLNMLCMYVSALAAPLWMVVHAQSRISGYETFMSCATVFTFLLSWLVILCGALPFTVVTVRFAVSFLSLFARLWFVCQVFPHFDARRWLRELLGNLTLVLILSVAAAACFDRLTVLPPAGRIMGVTVWSACAVAALSCLLALSPAERTTLIAAVRRKFTF